MAFELVCEIEPPARPDLKRVRHQIGVLSSVASSFVFAQVGFDLESLLRWRHQVDVVVPVYAGVMVLASAALARGLRASIPDIDIPRRSSTVSNGTIWQRCPRPASLCSASGKAARSTAPTSSPWPATATWLPASSSLSGGHESITSAGRLRLGEGGGWPSAAPGSSGRPARPDRRGRHHGSDALGPHPRTGGGAVSIGAVGALVDQVAGVMSGEAQRAPVVTSQISLRLSPLSCSALVVEPRVLRRGRVSVVSMVDVIDADTGDKVGVALFRATVLQGAGGSHQPPKDLGRHIIWRRQAEATGQVATDEYLDMHADEQDCSTHLARLELHDKLFNVSDVLHGGAAMLITEQAALLAARARGVPSPVVDDLDVHFLAPGQAGPLATRTVVVGVYGRRLNLAVELVDEGRGGRLVTVGMAGVGH